MAMPEQKPGRSKQDYATPWEFIKAVKQRFGGLDVDLAAHADNNRCVRFVSPEEDSLSLAWDEEFAGRRCWLNPPFENITPWAEKCAKSVSDAFNAQVNLEVLFLVPASVGSEWFRLHVHRKALVYAINPRISFDGKHPYPKDCMLALYSADHIVAEVAPGFDVWRWK